MTQEEVVKIKKIVEKVLSDKEEKQISLKYIYEKFSVYGLLFILVLGLLDYFTFTDIFHFSPSAFLNIYLFNTSLFDSALLLVIVFFPIVLLSLIFLMPYLAVTTSVYLNKKTERKWSKFVIFPIIGTIIPVTGNRIKSFLIKLKNNGHLDAIRLSLVFHLFFISLTLLIFFFIGPNSTYIWAYLLAIYVPIFFGFFFTIPYIKYRNDLVNNKSFSSLFLLYVIPSFVFLSFLLSLIPYAEFRAIIGVMLVIMSIPLVVSAQIIDFYSIQVSQLNLKFTPFIFSAIIISLIVGGTGYFYRINEKVWEDSNLTKENASMNLFLNRHFLSQNHEIVDLNLTNILFPNELDLNETKNRGLNKNTFFLPISKDIGLYFNGMHDQNKTLVYAIDKSDNKYNVLDVGFIDNAK